MPGRRKSRIRLLLPTPRLFPSRHNAALDTTPLLLPKGSCICIPLLLFLSGNKCIGEHGSSWSLKKGPQRDLLLLPVLCAVNLKLNHVISVAVLSKFKCLRQKNRVNWKSKDVFFVHEAAEPTDGHRGREHCWHAPLQPGHAHFFRSGHAHRLLRPLRVLPRARPIAQICDLLRVHAVL